MKEQWQYNGTKIAFSTNDAGTTGHLHVKKEKNESRHRLETLHKNHPKWILGLYVKWKTINLPEGNNTGENVNDLEYGNDF